MRFTRAAAVGVLSLCLSASLAATTPAGAEVGPAADPETVTAQPLSTWNTNGTVWDVEIVNNVAYVGGNFTKVRPPGAAAGDAGEVTRNRLAAFNATTGALLPWAPSATAAPYTVPAGTNPDINCTPLGNSQIECATVWSISATPDKTSIVVGGDFTAIDGKVRAGVAAFATASGALNTTFKPSVSGRIQTVAASDTGVWIGGAVTRAGGQTRTGLAAFDFPSGTLKTAFAPAVVRGTNTNILTGVRSIALTGDGTRLIVGGGFNGLAGRTQHGLGAVDAQTGATATWTSNRIVNAAAVTSVNVIGDRVYTTADAAGSESEGIIAFDAATGADLWYDSCRGASHSMTVVRGVVYAGSHSHDCGAMENAFGEQYQGYSTDDRRRYTLRAEVPSGGGAKLLQWFPRTNDGNGARTMATDGNTLWIGGEFTSVDNKNQQGLTRFSFLDQGAEDRKPITPAAPVVTSTKAGLVDVVWQQTEDPDNRELTYQLIRDHDTANPLYEVTSAGPPWLQGWMHYQDSVEDGSSHTYDVRAVDPLGVRSSRSPGSSVTAASSDVALADLAKRDGAAVQYSFETRNGSKYTDGVSGGTATAGTGAGTTTGAPTSGNAVSLTGSTRGVVVRDTREYSARHYTLESLFKTGTTRGGMIMSMGDSASTTGFASTDTGVLYMDNAGRLNFGLRPDAARSSANPWAGPSSSRKVVRTDAAFNNNEWHHVAVTFDPIAGSRIYVDGTLVAEDPTMTWSRSVNAYLRVGGDTVSGWANAPTSGWFAGAVDEVALYKHPLSVKQVNSHANTALGRLSAPTGLKATASGPSSVDLTWRPVTGATGYEVRRDGALVGSPTSTSFADSGLTATTAYAYTVVAVANGTSGPASDEVSVTTTAPLPIELFKTGHSWKYDPSGAPATEWNAASFDDSAWAGGPSELGHGEGDEATAITPFMPNGTTRRMTTYFRTSFEVPTGQVPTGLSLRFKLDDGVILYLNGQEVLRDNMPSGAVTAETKATTWAQDDGQQWRTVTIPVADLVSGTNVLAAEVHQNERSSLDLTWDAELTASFN